MMLLLDRAGQFCSKARPASAKRESSRKRCASLEIEECSYMAAGVLTAIVATGFGVGFAIGQPYLGSVLGIVIGAVVVYFILSRAAVE